MRSCVAFGSCPAAAFLVTCWAAFCSTGIWHPSLVQTKRIAAVLADFEQDGSHDALRVAFVVPSDSPQHGPQRLFERRPTLPDGRIIIANSITYVIKKERRLCLNLSIPRGLSFPHSPPRMGI